MANRAFPERPMPVNQTTIASDNRTLISWNASFYESDVVHTARSSSRLPRDEDIRDCEGDTTRRAYIYFLKHVLGWMSLFTFTRGKWGRRATIGIFTCEIFSDCVGAP